MPEIGDIGVSPHGPGIYHGKTSGMCPVCLTHGVCGCGWCHCKGLTRKKAPEGNLTLREREKLRQLETQTLRENDQKAKQEEEQEIKVKAN
ncbi:MAG: hypothetical protein JRN62_03380 [Nitrososphaerota archaeon]|jgi:hypothetical protein|nr:hypothetical protein [Nitrososphaerota archaeon]MDG6948640.1 hypothetical protein [Nitrososphaerota archaeon]